MMEPKQFFKYPSFDMQINMTEQNVPYHNARLAEHTLEAEYCHHRSTAACFSLGRVNSPQGGTAPGRSVDHNLKCVHTAGRMTRS